MPRRLKLETREKGTLDLLLIYQTGDQWESEWAPLQNTAFADLLAIIPDEAMNHALRGWTKPFCSALALPPPGALRKIPLLHRSCDHRARCPFYCATDCQPLGKKLPTCFQPAALESDAARILAYEIVRLWRESVYCVVVKETLDAHERYPRAR